MKIPILSDFLEHRQQQQDLILAALIARGGTSGGRSLANVQATAALEASAGLTGRSFAAADVSGPSMYTDAITPDLLEIVGRELIRRGELVCLIDTSDGLALWPAQSYDTDGPPDPRRWIYRVTVGGPSAYMDEHQRSCRGRPTLQICNRSRPTLARPLSLGGCL